MRDDEAKEQQQEEESSSSNVKPPNQNDQEEPTTTLAVATAEADIDHNDDKEDDDKDDDDDNVCPICFASPSNTMMNHDLVLAWGPCRHACCQACWERHLCHPLLPVATTRSSSIGRWRPNLLTTTTTTTTDTATTNNNSIIITPTMGPCPICRAQLSLFDLQHVVVNHHKKKQPWSSSSVSSGDYLYAKNYDLSPLHGSVYVDVSGRQSAGADSDDDDGLVGYGSFHFPKPNHNKGGDNDDTDNDDTDSEKQEANRPYFNIEKLPRLTHPTAKRLLPPHLFFAKGAHYYAPTRTFCGTLPLDNNDNVERGPFSHWDIYLSFSADLSMVRTGVIHKRRRIPASEQERMEWYPLDGWWTIVGGGGVGVDNLETRRANRRVHVVGNGFYDDELGVFHMLKCQVESPDDKDETSTTTTTTTAKNESSSRPAKNVGTALMVHGGTGKRIFEASLPIQATTTTTTTEMEASSQENEETTTTSTYYTVIPPKVGETLIWKRSKKPNENRTNDENDAERRETVIWRRETVSMQLPADEINQLGGLSGRIYQRWRASNELVRTAPTYHAASLWGNTFCQAMRVGLASYHFVSEQEGAYISYEHPDTRQWPPLDNGMPVPSRVPFHEISLPDPLTFRGSICWQDDYGTTWQGVARWNYEMKFDPSFYCIVSGHVQCLLASGIEREMSRYGEDLVYCNAALFDHFQATAPSLGDGPYRHGSPSNDDSNNISRINVDFIQDYHRGSEDLRRRLAVEAGASVRTVAMVRHIYTAARSAQLGNPIDLNLPRQNQMS